MEMQYVRRGKVAGDVPLEACCAGERWCAIYGGNVMIICDIPGFLTFKFQNSKAGVVDAEDLVTAPSIGEVVREKDDHFTENTELPNISLHNQGRMQLHRMLGKNRGSSSCPSIRGLFGKLRKDLNTHNFNKKVRKKP